MRSSSSSAALVGVVAVLTLVLRGAFAAMELAEAPRSIATDVPAAPPRGPDVRELAELVAPAPVRARTSGTPKPVTAFVARPSSSHPPRAEFGPEGDVQYWSGAMVDGKRDGPWVRWEAGEVVASKGYHEGALVGPWTKWYPGGRLAYHVDGYSQYGLEGRARYWAPDGTLESDLHYVRGELDGAARILRTDGTLDARASGIYRCGRRLGPLP